jgi:hypothetical protein
VTFQTAAPCQFCLHALIILFADRVEVEDDVYAAHLFEQLTDWLKELREVKQKQL